jgi:isocitrate/isopropylmalate dehydrogenase
MKRYRIAGLPGDGIGPECFEGALWVLSEAQKLFDLRLDTESFSAGAEHFRKHGAFCLKSTCKSTFRPTLCC